MSEPIIITPLGDLMQTTYIYPSQILMQFTGLLDKNGKEIYEGDILGYWCDAIWAVGWDKDKCGYYAVYGKENAGMEGEPAFRLSNNLCSKKEIIGNIYENPEK